MSYELVLRVLVQWSEKYHDEHPDEEHPLWGHHGPYNIQNECCLPSRSFRNVAHVSRWFHKRLFKRFLFFFERWKKYVDSGFVEACLKCEHFKRSQLVFCYGSCASWECRYHITLEDLEKEKRYLDNVRNAYYYVHQTSVRKAEERIYNLEHDLRCVTCICDWRNCDLSTIERLCSSAKETLETNEPGTQIFFDKTSRKLLVWEEDCDGYELDYAEEMACQLLKVC